MFERVTKKVVVDAGHGGEDPGAVANNLQEKDLNLQAAQYMYNRLQELGIPTVITRNTDETLSRRERINRILNAFGNSPDVIVVSNHINAGSGEGAEIVYALRNAPTLANLALNNIKEQGQVIRKIYQRRLPEDPNKDYYFIMRETGNTEPILVEYGFIDNINDVRKLTKNLNNYVEGVVKALAEYSGVDYIPPGNISENIYIVKKGDTLYSIANQFQTTVDTIKRLNNLTSNILTIGQELIINENIDIETNTTTYTVKKQDTLYQIAQLYDITVDELKQLNNLTNNNIYIGQKLIVPNKEVTIPDDEYEYYTVQKGDSLWKISKRYNISVDELININNLESINLQIGDQLLVPKINNTENTYTVQKGDSLWSIAKNNNITIDELKKANNLTSNLLTIGQILTIPN